MTAHYAASWPEANQRHLAAALDEVRRLLERHAAGEGDPCGRPDAGPGEAEQISPPAALENLCEIFGLSSFERRLLLLCAGVELDGSFAPLCAAAHGDPSRTLPTFGLALAAFQDAHWSALTPAAPLRYWRLIEVRSGGTLATSPLRIDERVLHYLAGTSHLDERLMGLVTPLVPPVDPVPSHGRLAGRMAAAWSNAGEGVPVIQLCGTDAADRHDLAAEACTRLGLDLWLLPADSLPGPADLESLARLWEREAALEGRALLLECRDASGHEVSAVARLVERLQSGLFVSSRDRLCTWQRPTVTFDVEKPLPEEQRELWRRREPDAAALADSLAAQFNLGSRELRTLAGSGMEPCGGGAAVWDACRLQTRPALENLAQRIEPSAAWDDLVLPPRQMEILREIALQVRQRARVYGEWGFGGRSNRGLGISALFEGASGTGKTMAAELLAGELRLDLYRIDLSQVVSKYIGETEKNLRRVFDAAESGGAVLLFDEADALFGKRSEIRDSHDRYANIEVSYLLQRMETYRGLAILTTNMKSALDQAFLRRIRFVVPFPFPDVPSRAEIWRRVFPRETPTDGLDPEKLARLNVAGGNIRNIALNAAFLAANDGGRVRMTHLLQAARSEYGKLEKPLSSTEVAGWV